MFLIDKQFPPLILPQSRQKLFIKKKKKDQPQ